MTVLVTGAGGFVGQNVIRYLSDRGEGVIGLYRNSIPECHTGKFFSCDLSKDDIKGAIGDIKIDAVLHFAGQMKGTKAEEHLTNTIIGTKRVIEYAESQGIEQFVYISSISVYGETLAAVDEDSDRINLDDYGMAKYFCERMLEDAGIKKRIVIRLPRTVGKGCDLSYPWLPKVTGRMLRGDDIYYTNPGLLYNNILYIDDLSKFLALLLNSGFSGYKRFVLGAKDRMKIIDILYLLKRELSSPSKLIERKAANRNKCFAINIHYAETYGFESRTVGEIIEKFVGDVKYLKGSENIE